jgi:hypothetical protein
MKARTLFRFLVSAVPGWFAATTGIAQNQLLIHGDFESGTIGTAPGGPYLVETEPGSSVVLAGTVHSPFVNVYPAGGQSVYLTDGGGALVWPHLRQAFTQQSPPAELQINFDFFLEGLLVVDDYWSFQIDDEDRNRAPFIALINGHENGVPNSFNILGSPTSVPLLADQWYNMSATMNLQSRLISATLTQFGGGSTSLFAPTLDGSFYATHVDIRDLTLGKNQPIYFDNLSVILTPVPEPSIGVLALLSAVGWTLYRTRRR